MSTLTDSQLSSVKSLLEEVGIVYSIIDGLGQRADDPSLGLLTGKGMLEIGKDAIKIQYPTFQLAVACLASGMLGRILAAADIDHQHQRIEITAAGRLRLSIHSGVCHVKFRDLEAAIAWLPNGSLQKFCQNLLPALDLSEIIVQPYAGYVPLSFIKLRRAELESQP